MELLIFIPVIAVMAGAAIYFALAEPTEPQPRRVRRPVPANRAPASQAEIALRRERAESDAANLASSDVLLADTLSELIELKEELSTLRSKVSQLEDQRVMPVADAAPKAQPRRASRRTPRHSTAPATNPA